MGNKAGWKTNDLEIAHDHGKERTPFSGGNSKMTRADIIHELLYIECKTTATKKDNSLTISENLILDTIEKAKVERKVPIVIKTKKQGPGKPKIRIVVMRYNDYLMMMKPEYRFGLTDQIDMNEFEKEVEE